MRTPWLALSGPGTVFVVNENFFSFATAACVVLTEGGNHVEIIVNFIHPGYWRIAGWADPVAE
ncbi:hypothetical protein INS49_012155 [Diaporthe citri]|uniref:uncharacterized protein n=1 Tax=Diaporthe citri TaxID=83186 RepID=UPI001C7ED197|nr:uncharacterized protein INS49_012155 [Diaporthe citri]KAG6358637.1 hypothetical protein INS49_012155 [Diaporthe citri]